MSHSKSVRIKATLGALATLAVLASGCEPATPGGGTDPTGPGTATGPDHCGAITGNEVWAAGTHKLTCTVDIKQGGQVTIEAGAVVKAAAGVQLIVRGNLLSNGTASTPVTLTSIDDNSVGGSTGTGNPSTSAWAGVLATDGQAKVHLDNVVLTNAAVGIDNQGGPDVRISGKILRSDIGARTPGFTGSGWDPRIYLLDARNVDWGSPTGPAPMGTGTAISGQGIMMAPYVGFQMPTPPTSVPSQPAPNNAACTSVTVLGLRGSNEVPRTGNNDPTQVGNYPNDGHGAGWVAHGSAGGLVDALNAKRPGSTWKVVGIQYPALMLPEIMRFPFPDFVRSVYYGGIQLKQFISEESARCPNSRFVVVGYSQGAASARMGLAMIDNTPLVDKVAGVVLMGDPSKPANSTEHVWNQPNHEVAADAKVRVRGGYFPLLSSTIFPAFSPALASRTWTACRDNDLFCATGPGAFFNDHMVYTGDDAYYMGYAAGVQLAPSLVG